MNKKNFKKIFICGMAVVCLTGCNSSKNTDYVSSLEADNAEYTKTKEKSQVLRCSNTSDENKNTIEILYDANGENVVGVSLKSITSDYDDPETQKETIENTFSTAGLDSYKVEVVDSHIEYEYVSTDKDKLKEVGFTNSISDEKQEYEDLEYTCEIVNNSK